ncbi:MAG: LssY C-terminal domain-containing protein [Terriglobia bacterium]
MPNVLTFKARRRHTLDSVYVLIIFFLLPCWSFAQQLLPSAAQLLITDSTPVKLQLAHTISSAHARRGDRLDFVVVEDVTVKGFMVIPAGTMAIGSVIKVKGKRLLGLGGEVIIKLDSVELVTGEKVRLRFRREYRGGAHTKLMAAEMILAGLIYLPAAPIFMLSHGHDSTVLKGTEVTAYIDGDYRVPSADLAKANESVSKMKEMTAFLPPRVLDGQGRAGDMINLLFIAKPDDLQRIFALAGWVKVDKLNLSIISRLLWHRNHYIRLPMATFFVFGRAQDYSYALPDPTAIVTRRHHLRIWKTDYQMNGSPVWAVSATHDVAIEILMRKLRISHRIDPNVDAEREFIARNLMETHLVTQVEYVTSAFPVFQAHTASGEAYHSDSRILLLDFSGRRAPTLAPEYSASVHSISPQSGMSVPGLPASGQAGMAKSHSESVPPVGVLSGSPTLSR